MRPARETQRPHKKPQQHLSNNKKTLTKTHPKKKKKKKKGPATTAHSRDRSLLQVSIGEINNASKGSMHAGDFIRYISTAMSNIVEKPRYLCKPEILLRRCCMPPKRERGGRLCCMLPMQEREKGWGGEMYVLACKTFCNFFY